MNDRLFATNAIEVTRQHHNVALIELKALQKHLTEHITCFEEHLAKENDRVFSPGWIEDDYNYLIKAHNELARGNGAALVRGVDL